jgi:hypothetical protein
MRITIIPEDGRVSINGVGYNGLDLSAIDPSVHAVQWYDTEGEVEIKDARGRMVENRVIDSFDEFAFVIPLWEAAKAADELLKTELAAKMEAQANVTAQTS